MKSKGNVKAKGRKTRSPMASLGRVLGGERVAELDLATRGIVGHLQVTGTSLWAWYQLGGQPWSFTTESQRRTLWDQLTVRLAGLSGRAIRLRTTTKPYPAFEFGRSLDADTPNPLPDVDPEHSFDAYLERQQRRLHNRLLDEKVVTLGVRVGNAPKKGLVRALAELEGHPPSGSGVAKLIDEVRKLNEHVAGAGLGGRPLDAAQMAWLMHRSVGLGMPVPVHAGVAGSVWDQDDLLAFTDPVNWYYTPMGGTVRVEGIVSGRKVTRHVAVLSLGRMADRKFPEDGLSPWMLEADRMEFPVEWSASGLLVSSKDLTSTVEYERNRAQGIEKHYAEHGELPPPAVGRAITQAIDTYDEVTEGDSRVSVRFAGPIRIAVHAPTEDECLKRARAVIDRYGERLRIEVAHPQAQHEMLREFIPGEPWSTLGYQRRMPVGYLAAAMPHVNSNVGTPTGPYLAHTIGSARRAVRHDGHFPMERMNTPGLVPLVAEPGGGKSYAVGTLAYHGARRGQPTVVLDPSGPLAKLCTLPELAPYSRRLDLNESEPGTLAPWQLVPEPHRSDYTNDREFARAVKRARAERSQLGFDVMRMMLPSAMLRDPRVDAALRDAIRHVGGEVTANPRGVITSLDQIDSDAAREVSRHLRDAAEFPLGELIFPEYDQPIESNIADDRALVVITMPGLQTPDPDIPRENWSTEELYAAPLLHLAAFFTSRYIYRRDRNVRKNLFLDENHFMAQWGSGRALFVRLSRDSRKWNTAVYAASQHPDDVLGVGKVEALIGGAFVGRLEDIQTARSAMRLLRAPEEYASVVTGLSPKPPPGQMSTDRSGEFLYRDAYGRVDKIRLDSQWHPELHDVLVSTPGEGHIYQRVTTAEAPPPLFMADIDIPTDGPSDSEAAA